MVLRLVWLPRGILRYTAPITMTPFSLVAKMASVHFLLSMAVMSSWPLDQLDIKNVFLHGDLAEEVYMEQLPGFVAQGESGLVCRLRRSLYGLKQSPQAWFGRFSSVVHEFDMTRCTSYHFVFYHHSSSEKCIYLIVYVDDIVITDNDQDGIRKHKQHLFRQFQTKDLGKVKYFLGLRYLSLISVWLCLRESMSWIYGRKLVCWTVNM